MQKFYLFDLEKKQFLYVERQSLRKLYISNNYCNYCLCGKSVISSNDFINHLSTLESTYYCYLILNHLKENDERNRRRIDLLVRDFEKRQAKSSGICANTNLDAQKAGFAGSIKSTEKVKCELKNVESNAEIDGSQSKQLIRTPNDVSSIGGDWFSVGMSSAEATSKSLVTLQTDQSLVPYSRNPLILRIESAIKRNFDELQNMIQQLEDDTRRPGLLESLIQKQASLLLVKRVENYQNANNYLSFSKKINLSANDLNPLLAKYEISNRLRIDKAELCLNLVMKSESGLSVNQSLPSVTYDLASHNTNGGFGAHNGGYDPATKFDLSSVTIANQNSTAYSVYQDCPDPNSIRHDASHLPATNFSSNDSTKYANQTNAPQKSDSNRSGATHFDPETDTAFESLTAESAEPSKPQTPEVKKSEPDHSLVYLSNSKLLNFKIPKKPQVNSFGYFNDSPDSHSNRSPNRDSYSSPRANRSPYKGHSPYKRSGGTASYHGRY